MCIYCLLFGDYLTSVWNIKWLNIAAKYSDLCLLCAIFFDSIALEWRAQGSYRDVFVTAQHVH